MSRKSTVSASASHDLSIKNQNTFTTIRSVLEIAGMSPRPISGAFGFTTTFRDEGPDVTGLAYLLPNEERFLFYLEFTRKAPDTTRSQVVEFITRANYDLAIGNFEFDYESGAIRFKSSVDFQGNELPASLVRNVILAAMDAVETYSETLVEVMEGKILPKPAIDKLESF